MNILEEIIAYKKFEVEKSKEKLSLQGMINHASTGFTNAVKLKTDKKQIALIAEIKKSSPSKGIIKKDFNHIEIAKAYKNSGAACLSVLTDKKYFGGDLNYIQEIKAHSDCKNLLVLRKDFIIDSYQVYESIYYGADCILLIVAALEKNKLKELFEVSCENNMDCLVEVHDEREMEIALDLIGIFHGMPLLGINNRDLKTFETNLDITIRLAENYKRDLKNKIIVSESGISTNQDIRMLIEHNVYAFLVGEALLKQKDIEKATKDLINV